MHLHCEKLRPSTASLTTANNILTCFDHEVPPSDWLVKQWNDQRKKGPIKVRYWSKPSTSISCQIFLSRNPTAALFFLLFFANVAFSLFVNLLGKFLSYGWYFWFKTDPTGQPLFKTILHELLKSIMWTYSSDITFPEMGHLLCLDRRDKIIVLHSGFISSQEYFKRTDKLTGLFLIISKLCHVSFI